MKLILYSNGTNIAGKQLQQVIESMIPVKMREIYRTTESLSSRFRQPGITDIIAVLFAASKEELSDILLIRKLLSDLRVILILPDRENETIKQGHTLYPRYVSYADTDFKDVAAVLRKMFGLVYSGNET